MSNALHIVNVEPRAYCEPARRQLQALGELRECEPLTRAALLEDVATANVVITRLAHHFDEAVFAAAPDLRALVTATTGLTHVDLDAAQRHGVTVLSLKGETEFLNSVTATAELTWGLLLNVCRRLPAADRDVADGHWRRDAFKGRELEGKTLGVLGMGRLGRLVAAYGQAFQMRVVANDVKPVEMPVGVEAVSFDALLRASDVLSVHVDLNETTHAMLDAAAFGRMKVGSILVNTSRGEVVVEDDLIGTLEQGHLAGAGLDVLAGEPFADDAALTRNPLWQWGRQHEQLVITPHIGGATFESMEATEVFMANKLERWLRNAKPAQEENA